MKAIISGVSRRSNGGLILALVATGFLFALLPARLVAADPMPPEDTNYPAYTPLNSWSFRDTNNWTSDYGYAPLSFTNIAGLLFGDFTSLGLNTNVPGWLRYNVVENDGTTNLTLDQGSLAFWFAPAWAGNNEGGSGPGLWGRLIEVGGYTSDASYGWWSLYVDDVGANLYFTVQPGDSSTTTYLTAPISWTSNYWHFVALTYSVTNTALYLDGALATNGPGLTARPGSNVLAGGFYIGSDSNGVNQAQGAFDDLYTFNVALDSDTVSGLFNSFYAGYYLSPWNMMASIFSAPSNPSTNAVTPDVITGPGYLEWVGAASTCDYGTNAYNVWITNVTASVAGDGTINVTFTIEGGLSGNYYDVFANSALSPGPNGLPWSWMGQGTNCAIYTLNISSSTAFLILGTPLDADGDGLTSAYELLASKTDPNSADSDGDGIPDGWEVLLGLNPLLNDNAQSSSRSNYAYDFADWLEVITGIRTGSVSLDNEGNVLSVSQ